MARKHADMATPRWVKVFGVVALVLVLIVVIGLLTGHAGPGRHGPGRHAASGDLGTRPAGVPEGQTPPPGIRDQGAERP